MAIAKMKKLTLLSEQSNKEVLLKSLQEMQSVEMIPLSDVLEEELVEQFKFVSNQQESSELTENLQNIRQSLSFIRQYIPEAKLLEKLKSKREVLSLEELEDYVHKLDVDEMIQKINQREKKLLQLVEEKKELEEQEQFLRKWKNLHFLPEETDCFQVMDASVGSLDIEYMDEFKNVLNEMGTVYFEEIFQTKDQAAYLCILPKADEESFDELTTQTGFQKLNYDYEVLPKEALKQNLDEQKAINKQQTEIKKEMKGWKDTALDLQFAEEYYYNIQERELAHELILNSNYLFIISGWIEEEKISSVNEAIEKDLGDDAVAILTDDIKEIEYDQVPVVLKNNKIVEPFEMITEMYSYPKYNEADPTAFMSPFFFLFFGMMSADAGYGLLLCIATLIALKAFNLEGGMKRFIRFFHRLSYSTIGFGLFFGSFFGIDLPFVVMSLQEDVIEIMILSVAFGFIQLFAGLIINGVVKQRQGERASSYIDGYSWAMMLLGLLFWIIGEMVLNNSILANAGIGLILINVAGILIVSTVSSDKKVLGFGLGLYNLYGVTGYIGDFVSYTRLMALAVASANIALAFNMILSFLPPVLLFTVGILLAIILHSINIALAFLSGFVHSARLQYVEFFGKFYEGGGRTLAPLKTLEKHIWLEERK